MSRRLVSAGRGAAVARDSDNARPRSLLARGRLTVDQTAPRDGSDHFQQAVVLADARGSMRGAGEGGTIPSGHGKGRRLLPHATGAAA